MHKLLVKVIIVFFLGHLSSQYTRYIRNFRYTQEELEGGRNSALLSRLLGHRHPNHGVPGDDFDQLLLLPVPGPGRPSRQHHVPAVSRAVVHHQPHLQ